MTYLRMTLLFFAAAAAHWWQSAYFTFFGVSPQLLLVLTVVAAARRGPIAAMCFGFAWGLFIDFFRAHLFGANALAFTLVGYGVGSARRQIDVTSLAPLCVITLSLSWGYFLLTGLLGAVFLHSFTWVGWEAFVLDPFINCLIIPVLFVVWDGVVGNSHAA